jgi:hypothetical protein
MAGPDRIGFLAKTRKTNRIGVDCVRAACPESGMPSGSTLVEFATDPHSPAGSGKGYFTAWNA